MHLKSANTIGLALCLLLAVGCASGEKNTSSGVIPANYDGEMTPEAMMAAMVELGQTGPEHRALDFFIGEFRVDLTSYVPGMEPIESRGRMINKWVLGGKWVQGEFRGAFAGEPFSGLSYMTYDTSTDEYVGMWMDSAAPWLMPPARGAMEDGELVMRRSWMNPMYGYEVEMREVTRILSDDEFDFEMYEKGPDGDERLQMKIHYERI